MNAMNAVVRPPAVADEAAWRELWAGYNKFYRATLPEDVTAELWRKLLARDAGIFALVAEQHGVLVGLAHVLFHPSTWSHAPSCYLEDLFVAKPARGGEAGAALIEGVTELARGRGADRLYWHTQEFNSAARSLYDTVAERTSFIVYRKGL
jgi:GNAT superfamily N-acetyltransferase